MRIMMLCCTALAFLMASCSEDKPTTPETKIEATFLPPSEFDTTLSFITINMAVGFDAEKMLVKDMRSPQVVLQEGLLLYSQLVESKPEERIIKLADSIAALSPDVISLQEVLYLENRDNGDTVDFLKIFRNRLESKSGIVYKSILQPINPLEIKVTVTTPNADSVDIYFLEGNAILYKNSALTLQASDSAMYSFGLRNIPYLTTRISILRGVVFARLRTKLGTTFSVFNTHLEVEAIPGVSSSQTNELKEYIHSRVLPGEATVVMGDFNNQPNEKNVIILKNDGFFECHEGSNELTCCYDIIDPSVNATRRIDYIFAKNIVAYSGMDIFNYRVSDHAAVFSLITFH